MKRSAVDYYSTVHEKHPLDAVTFLDLAHIAEDDVAKPEHVTERHANLAAIHTRKIAEREGKAVVGAIGAGQPIDLAMIAGAIDYEKLATVLAAKLKATAAPATSPVNEAPFGVSA